VLAHGDDDVLEHFDRFGAAHRVLGHGRCMKCQRPRRAAGADVRGRFGLDPKHLGHHPVELHLDELGQDYLGQAAA
jgi:hypothetical protein